ncbi:MAG: sterol desaturase family protein [Nostocaceae cyanobacterium]|nr:sterol desaturase family protein [Nostocaceae cyanobacterium]
MIVFAAFVILLTVTAVTDNGLSKLGSKSQEDWILDGFGLCFQGIVIPILQIRIVYQLYQYLLPNLQGFLNFYPLIGFCLSFVLVDYLYYWNHRLFHSSSLWSIHQVHHTVTEMDVLGTSRNTLWTSFLIIYLWVHPLFIYLLKDPTWYIFGVSLTSALDLWRHSRLTPKGNSLIFHFLSPWLILPQDHAWHHSENINCNYGANWKIWDRIHGTYYQSETVPDYLGVETNLSLKNQLFYPFIL